MYSNKLLTVAGAASRSIRPSNKLRQSTEWVQRHAHLEGGPKSDDTLL